MKRDDNLYAQFLTIDGNISFNRIVRLAKFSVDRHFNQTEHPRIRQNDDDLASFEPEMSIAS